MKSRKRRKQRLVEGCPVVDATKPITIEITAADVAGSKKSDPAMCAAAKALSRELQTDVRVHLSRTYVKDKKKKRWVRLATPASIAREITAFDRGAEFVPGVYHLAPLPESERLGNLQPRQHSNTGTGGPKRPHHITAHVREWSARR